MEQTIRALILTLATQGTGEMGGFQGLSCTVRVTDCINLAKNIRRMVVLSKRSHGSIRLQPFAAARSGPLDLHRLGDKERNESRSS